MINKAESKKFSFQKAFTNKKTREKVDGWLFVLPFVISVLMFLIGPMIVAFILSFKKYSFLDGISIFQAKSVGLKNYINVFQDEVFKKALLNTFTYSLAVVPIQLVIALLLSLVVNSDIKGKTFFRVAYYIPTLTSTVAVSVMFLFIFKVDGIMNRFLALFKVPPNNWFSDPKFALPAIISMAIWSSVGNYMIIFLSGLQDIPESLYEAARIDGANKTQEFFKITLPLIKPTFFFNLIISIIGTLQIFDQAYVISGGTGGPLDATMTVVLYLYNKGFKQFEMGYASAIAFVLFVIILTLTLIQKKFFKEESFF
ncbi:carbohydrate ABC transporter membrane protein 1, CUT1 family [Clostridium amylolyticum]|uniref:Carbohydrate ABC transporter membrane protein 1, CUT1 family n=1 Tax=Clostridium amylolyticum TaxID=1121298 RepID=A0A1M6C887_9CLOT|nr:sugar ABC transporter permease [Clostridium amylolyticum]SHI56948.1 carbohydrate ABC transporter membrane protein 1, CUT1 family [Clostridium amylolyticum]